MRKILVLGATGQIGSALKKDLIGWEKVEFLNRNELDFKKIEGIETKIKEFQPDFIINAAAYTNVDGAEDFREEAFQINISVTQTRKDMPILSVTMKIEIVGDCKRTNLLIALQLELQWEVLVVFFLKYQPQN